MGPVVIVDNVWIDANFIVLKNIKSYMVLIPPTLQVISREFREAKKLEKIARGFTTLPTDKGLIKNQDY